MGKKHKNIPNQAFPKKEKVPSSNEGEYDLGHNLRKVNSYSKSSHKPAYNPNFTNGEESYRGGGRVADSNLDYLSQTATGGVGWNMDSYYRLDDRISDVIKNNDSEHTALRKELEGKIKDSENSLSARIDSMDSKIENRMSSSTFYWVIGGLLAILVVIATLWWTTSYNEVSKSPTQIQEINYKLRTLETTLTYPQNDTISVRSK